MAGLKVRLDDGSEVGPMDLAMVQTWLQQGLIGHDTLVQRPGSSRWVRLADAVDLGDSRTGGAARRGRGPGRGAGLASPDEDAGGERWRSLVASALFLVLAVAAFLAAAWPDRVRPELDDAPWIQVGLVLGALGLLLVRGWNAGRRAVRVVSLLAAAAAFPLAGLFVARGMRHEALLVLASCWLLASGFVAFLAPRLSRLAAAAALLAVTLGAAGLVRFAPAERGSLPEVAEWAAPERSAADPEIGLDIALPPGWVVLKPGSPLIPAPATARLTLAQPRVSGYAFTLSEPPPPRVLGLEHYLDYLIAQRRAAATALEEDWRRDGRLGALPSRRASNRRGAPGERQVERIAVAQDGDRYFALVAWVPEAGGGRALEEVDALEAATALSGVRSAGRRDAVQTANLELPHLSLPVIERLVATGGPATPADLFRRASAALVRGVGSLPAADAQELRTLTAAATASLAWKERSQLSDYLRRLGAGLPTNPDEDERMRLLIKSATVRLGAAQRARLEALNERAIGAGL